MRLWPVWVGLATLLVAGIALGGGYLPVPRPGSGARDMAPAPGPAMGSEPVRIVAFGTSLSARYDWPDRLGAALTSCLDHPVEVTRIAGAGQNSAWGQGQLDRVLAHDPDLVLMEFTANDAALDKGMRLSESRRRHREMIGALTAAEPDIRLVLMGMSPSFGLRGALRFRQPAYLDSYRDLAATIPAVGYVDLRARWWAALDGQPPRRLLPDGLHPTPEAAEAVIVPILTGYLGTYLAAPSGPDC